MPAEIIGNLGVSSAFITGAAQFGDKFFLTTEDHRPVYAQGTYEDSRPKLYLCGIKPPNTAPTLAHSGSGATNMPASTVVYVAYAFHSKKRNVSSQLSPAATITTASSSVKKVTVSKFMFPRDDASSQDIDTVIVAVQFGTLSGKKAILSNGPAQMYSTWVDVSDYNFTGKTFDVDVSAAQLALGYDMDAANKYHAVPPAVKFCARYGERLYFGGQREKFTPTSANIVVTKNSTYRQSAGEISTRAKCVVSNFATGATRQQDDWLWMSLRVNGNYIGEVWDVDSTVDNVGSQTGSIFYLDRDIEANIAATTDWELLGHNDRVYPSSYLNYTPGKIPTVVPECVNLIDRQLLTQVLDEGSSMAGLEASGEYLYVLFDNAAALMAGGTQVNTPLLTHRKLHGVTGPIAQRSVCRNDKGELAWISQEGITTISTGGVRALAEELAIVDFFRPEANWLSKTALSGLVMAWSRKHRGYLIGNMTVAGTANVWGLVTLRPQPGLWLFDGVAIDSNILTYLDSNGREVLLAGDAVDGRIKELLDPAVLTDLSTTADTTAAYDSFWREGFVSNADGETFRMGRVRIPGVTLYTESDPAFTIKYVGSNYGTRHQGDYTSVAAKEESLTKDVADLVRRGDKAIGKNSYRYHSVGVQWSSTAGDKQSGDVVSPMELSRFYSVAQGNNR